MKCQLTICVVYFKYSRANISDEEDDLELGKLPIKEGEEFNIESPSYFMRVVFTVFTVKLSSSGPGPGRVKVR